MLGAVLLLAGCGSGVQKQPAANASPAVDPQIRSLRAQLARARAERDAALARLHAVLKRKSAVTRVVVREPAVASPHLSDSGQPASRVFSTITTQP
jgi:hypothetical protein